MKIRFTKKCQQQNLSSKNFLIENKSQKDSEDSKEKLLLNLLIKSV
jgi:hypothetical protein